MTTQLSWMFSRCSACPVFPTSHTGLAVKPSTWEYFEIHLVILGSAWGRSSECSWDKNDNVHDEISLRSLEASILVLKYDNMAYQTDNSIFLFSFRIKNPQKQKWIHFSRGWGTSTSWGNPTRWSPACWLGCQHLLWSRMRNRNIKNDDHLHVGALILAWVKSHLCTHFKHYVCLEMEKCAQYEFSDRHFMVSYQIRSPHCSSSKTSTGVQALGRTLSLLKSCKHWKTTICTNIFWGNLWCPLLCWPYGDYPFCRRHSWVSTSWSGRRTQRGAACSPSRCTFGRGKGFNGTDMSKQPGDRDWLAKSVPKKWMNGDGSVK